MKTSSFLPKFSFSYISLLIIIFLFYTFAGKLGLEFASINASVSAIWPPTGIAIAVLLLFGYRVWPAILLGAFVVNLTTQGNAATSLGIALGNTLEGIAAYYCINRFAQGKEVFEKVKNVLAFSFFAGLLSPMLSATIGVVTLVLGGLAVWSNFFQIWFTWWLGDMSGALLVAPFIFLLFYRFKPVLDLKRLGEFFLFLLLVGSVGELTFSGLLPYPYLCIPILVFGAFRFDQKEESIAILLFAIISIWNTLHGVSPFVIGRSINDGLILMQLFMATVAVTSMTIATALLERKQSQHALISGEHRFKALIEKSWDAVVLIDATSKIIYASPSVKRLLGYDPEELVGMFGFDLVDPEDRTRTMQELAKLVLKPGGTVTIEYRTIRQDNKIIWVEATGTNLLLEDGVNAVVINFQDITERKASTEKLAQEKAQDEALLKSIGEGMIATDDTGRITLVNDVALDMLGCKTNDLIGKSIITAISMQDGEGRTLTDEERPMTKVIQQGKRIVTSPNNYYVRADKTKFPVRFTVTPVILDKKLVGTIEIFRDITHETEVDKAKTEFVSLASHQLRTPLTTINWYIERLTTVTEPPEKQRRYLKEVYYASRRMTNLINALLNTSRLELGTFIVEPKELDLSALIAKVLGEFGHQIVLKHLHMTKKLPEKPLLMMADEKLIDMVLQNLISNAIRYSKEKGKVTITLDSDTKGFTISVADTGYGIPKKDQKNIFTKMFRADNAKMVDQEGTGLGLYMVESIVSRTGGKVWFHSEENKGTTFFVWFPKSGMKRKEGAKRMR